MVQPEMSPQPPRLSTRPGNSISSDDIDLPPLPQSEAVSETLRTEAHGTDGARSINIGERSGSLLLAGVAAGILGLAAWFYAQPAAGEAAHPGWQQVSAATDASTTAGSTAFLHTDTSGASRIAPAIRLTSADADQLTTLTVRHSLMTNDPAAAIAAIKAAARISLAPALQSNNQSAAPKPALKPDVLIPVRDGKAEFFHISVFDCCAEDGDIVQILLNGDESAEVPLTHSGSVISLPLTPGTTTMTLRGIHDGGGRITVMFRTSQGDFFSRSMDVGEWLSGCCGLNRSDWPVSVTGLRCNAI